MIPIDLGTHDEERRRETLFAMLTRAGIEGQRGASPSVFVQMIADAAEGYPDEMGEVCQQIKMLAAMAIADRITDFGRNDPASN